MHGQYGNRSSLRSDNFALEVASITVGFSRVYTKFLVGLRTLIQCALQLLSRVVPRRAPASATNTNRYELFTAEPLGRCMLASAPLDPA